ncbi:prepilin-type N-terminal cleavage/methylation domain-containing protein [Desulfobotulus alkaliphilus]|uniref:Prepilin-type N-terminal cleavage/methylation domain-containing protein n=1 Tax=Desulfobotulus alkaliphilus TaxID=622671 RepID=A0A562RRS3_9BACT|nr:prepilin-type N-terminal cleavage/methylation domain-containing protein [Desulfobotulus alkaliphilus]TWI71819.1 prepilin-type N-terminal cleavage/methylation domain-containing protein [Desulfobotulus alkaliphilus]
MIAKMKHDLDSKGFTLLELVVAMGVMAILGAVLMTQFIHHMDMYVRQKAKIDTQQKVRTVLMWMEDEFRMAGFNPSFRPLPSHPVLMAEAETFAFFYRQDSGDSWKRLDYYMGADGWLRRRDRNGLDNLGSVSRILENARLNFVYLDRHQNAIDSPKEDDYPRIRAVRIELGASYEDRRGRLGNVDLVTTVKCRNLGIGS